MSDQIKAEREAAIIEGVIDRLFTADARRRWANRLGEMTLIFKATGRDEPAAMAATVAAALGDEGGRRAPSPPCAPSCSAGRYGRESQGTSKLSDVTRAAVRPQRS